MFRVLKSVCAAVVALSAAACQADIIDFNNWTLVADPSHANFTSSVDSSSQITLHAADGSIPHATDIGYQSVNGSTPANSTAGYAFSPSFDFSVAVDFVLTFDSPSGGLAIGFGIGEDKDGENSAGVVLLTNNGTPFFVFGSAARINDVNQSPQAVPVAGQSTGRFIASYQSATGNVTLGVSTNGDDTPEVGTATFGNIQNNWNGGRLLTSFFLRSDSSLGTAWTSGTADAVFSNFHVISGTPLAVPEPSTFTLAALALLGLVARGHRRRRTWQPTHETGEPRRTPPRRILMWAYPAGSTYLDHSTCGSLRATSASTSHSSARRVKLRVAGARPLLLG